MKYVVSPSVTKLCNLGQYHDIASEVGWFIYEQDLRFPFQRTCRFHLAEVRRYSGASFPRELTPG